MGSSPKRVTTIKGLAEMLTPFLFNLKTHKLTDTFESKIEFGKIRSMLRQYCLSMLGCEKVDAMTFSKDFDVVTRMVNETREMQQILSCEDFPSENYFDLREALKHLRIENTFIETKDLFDLKRTLDTIHSISAVVRKQEETSSPAANARQKEETDRSLYPYLHELASEIKTFPALVRKIDRIVDELGNMRDSASPELASIRREKASMAGRISKILSRILQNAQSEGLVEKNTAPSMRDGRLVIPVSPYLKKRIGGIVHDESDTGKTVYIEPTEVVEANNRVRELENDERKEIVRILREFSSELRPDIPEILKSLDFLGDVDFIRAKAKFANTTDSRMPVIKNTTIVDWSIARHPLLYLSLQKKGDGQKAVPLDIELKAPNARILLISGPNAGGKSVCLKTVGLLQYMLQCGMLVPMAESSVCGIFDKIFIDIGDEQSIENELSTYSSHLINMKNMLRQSNAKSLLLIDEFGGGTEPQIGGAMAQAMLQKFNYKKTFAVITTHFQNLKNFAQETIGIVNGAMLYDKQNMQPLFQLRIGNPGSSFAIEIAHKIGIPDEIINTASEIVGKDYINSEKYLQDIARDKKYWENKRDAIHQHEKRMEQTIAKYELEIMRLKDEKKEIIKKAKEEALQLLSESNARIELTIKEIKEAEAEKLKTLNIRQNLNDFKQQIKNLDDELMEQKLQRQIDKIKARQKRKEEKKKKKAEQQSLPQATNVSTQLSASPVPSEAPLQNGDFVKLKGQTSIGKIVKISGKEALVAFDSIQTNVKLNRLEHSEAPKTERRAITFVSQETQNNIRQTMLDFSSEIDVRGMRTSEAIDAVTEFIDNAVVASASRLRILHGTGNGILRTMIRQYLSSQPVVATFYDEDVRMGGAGITIVELI